MRASLVVFLCLGLMSSWAGAAGAAEEWNPEEASVTMMSLDELVYVDVTSVSKKAQKANEAASAIYVVTSEDIRRSGATSVPDALRMVPGLTVGGINANLWAISARGFASEFSNKMLVMVDGRTVYTELFAGTYWDVQDVVMEDIDRIEVIRGPGATVWGANAVNGVINVITKKSSDTQGLLSATIGGSHLLSQVLRYGGPVGDAGNYRVYGKAYKRESFDTYDGTEGPDEGTQGRVGFRMDLGDGETNSYKLSGEFYDGETGTAGTLYASIAPPITTHYEEDGEVRGGHLLGNWDHAFSETSILSMQSYLDYSERSAPNLGQEVFTFDVELQHRFAPIQNNELTWGLGFRTTQDEIENSLQIGFYPDSETMNRYSGFLQDEHSFLDDVLRVTAGAKLEQNHFTGWEFQPSLRFIAFPKERHSFWGAVSRAVQTRSRIDNFKLITFVQPDFSGGPPPEWIANGNIGDDESVAERVYAFELGYRGMIAESASLDVTAFYNKHNHQLGSNDFTFQRDPTDSYYERFRIMSDKINADAYGLEIAANWVVTSNWTLGAGYSYLNVEIEDDPDEQDYPSHQFNARSKLNLPFNLEFDTFLYYVDEIPQQDLYSLPPGPVVLLEPVDAYVRVDLRLGWKPTENIDLSLVGQNLFSDDHREFGTGVGEQDTNVPRAGYVKLTLDF